MAVAVLLQMQNEFHFHPDKIRVVGLTHHIGNTPHAVQPVCQKGSKISEIYLIEPYRYRYGRNHCAPS